ncbi:hypothetical protein PIB30_051032 [Stylosanthes scabra]|uniref:Uncharacterized protein n=1 Tax=Stylosanthes scabra TaxID=79078 RepID=A0ABU6YIA1_9FABA|nr:hypothetical protein [Stylosanthes scabra]
MASINSNDSSSTQTASFPGSTSTPIYMKLDNNNKDQAESIIEGNDILNHITRTKIPQQYYESGLVNPEYQRWKREEFNSLVFKEARSSGEIADTFTKALPSTSFMQLRDQLTVQRISLCSAQVDEKATTNLEEVKES